MDMGTMSPMRTTIHRPKRWAMLPLHLLAIAVVTVGIVFVADDAAAFSLGQSLIGSRSSGGGAVSGCAHDANPQQHIIQRPSVGQQASLGRLFAFYDEQSPSDYSEVLESKSLEVDTKEADALIRDELKRELLLLSSVTNRGEYASKDEQNMLIDLVAQLEAINPTADPARNLQGEWDLCLSSTQFFRTSPFFQSLRRVMDQPMSANFFDIHDKATTSGRVGRVRQIITENRLISELDLEVGLFPGLPFKVKGTVITTADFKPVGSDTFELQVDKTQVKGSNVPILNQFLEDVKLELPLSQAFTTLTGSLPVVTNKIFYLDEGMRIVRDEDENFFVFTRA
jgi:PAP_fibrillin